MQVFTLKPRSLGASWLVALWFMFMGGGVIHAQGGWTNDNPIYEYEDESPTIDPAILIRLHNFSQAYNIAGEYHNKHFKKEFLRREADNFVFGQRWQQFAARWVAWNDISERYVRQVMVDAGEIRAGAPIKNIKTMQLRAQAVGFCQNLVEYARGLTFYLEDDTVIRKWEIFIRRLEYMEDALQELED